MSKTSMNAYKKTQVTTATKEQVLILLYEGCIKYLKVASDAAAKKDLNAKGIAVGKAHDIINELSNTLDFNVGGEVAKNLENLYSFMTAELLAGNVANDPAKFDAVRKLMETLLEGWKGAVAQIQADRGKK